MSCPNGASPDDYAQLYGHLPSHFQPHDFVQRSARSNWRTTIQQALPVSELPHGLELRRGLHNQPPRFDFGWKLSAEELVSLAQRHGLTYGSTGIGGTIDTARLSVLLNQLLEKEGIYTSYVRIDMILSDGATPTYSVTLADNYRSGNWKPAANSLDGLKRFLGVDAGRELGWYLDQKWCNWQWKNAEDIVVAEERNYGRRSTEQRR
ncbi:hypothetical protein DFP72DRAFT_918122 [Ephemerocybe angulata]|uniref:Uncharacterized protein n=1 Tax=Ephemerocybe angulata TaxID=980116 RepID=A0A8H6HLD6_9AGAR|nr:hypothetical protein DFP72DRAFT_918122 [Tulosesus angulatus]